MVLGGESITVQLQKLDLVSVLLCGMQEVDLLQPCSLQAWQCWV